MKNLKSKHYFNVVSTRLFFQVTGSFLEHRHKKEENVLMTIFRNIKSRHDKLKLFFQIIFFYKIFEEFVFNRAIGVNNFTNLNSKFIKYYRSLRIGFDGCFWKHMNSSIFIRYAKETVFLYFSKNINMSKQRTLPSISLENSWQISFLLEKLFRS